MFCSVIIPTVARPTLGRAVESVLVQDFTADDYEVIVVNDSGQPLPLADWMSSERIHILNTNRWHQNVARNTGASIARGRFLHFLDDDDWLLPGALQSFWGLSRSSEARFLYGGAIVHNRQDNPVDRTHTDLSGNCFVQMIAGEWIPTGSFMIEAQAYFALRGFDPVVVASATCTFRRWAALYNDFASTSEDVLCCRFGAEGSTIEQSRRPILRRWAREQILNQPEAFKRLKTSARSSYWHGHLVRAYLTSTIWNVQHRRPLIALSRALAGGTAVALAGGRLFSGHFWKAIIDGHKTGDR